MKRPWQHEIDTKAQQIFIASVPSEWVCRPITLDYGIDYEIEVFCDHRSTGIIFKVQLKGSKELNYINDGRYISFNINVDTIKYYIEEIKIPLFLILVDVGENVIFWHDPITDLNLKDHYLSAVKNGQKSINVLINSANQLPQGWSKLIIEFDKALLYISIRHFLKGADSNLSDIFKLFVKDNVIVNDLQEKIDILKLESIREKIVSRDYINALGEINVILTSTNATNETKFNALLLSENINLKLSIEKDDKQDIGLLDISMAHIQAIKRITKKGPQIIKLYALASEKVIELLYNVKHEYNAYVNYKLHEESQDILWKNAVVCCRADYIHSIKTLYYQVKRLISLASKNGHHIIIPKITIRLLLGFNTYLLRLRLENLSEAVDYFKNEIDSLLDVCLQICDIYKEYDDFERLCCLYPTYTNMENEVECNNDFKRVADAIKSIKDEEISSRILNKFEAQIALWKSGYTNVKNNKRELSIDDEIKYYRASALALGIDLDNDNDDISNIINIGIHDLNPERVLKNCEYIFIKSLSVGLPGQWLKLPTAGSKMLICVKTNHAISGLMLDRVYEIFKNEFCNNCTECKPHKTSWKWTRAWQCEQDKMYFEKYRKWGSS